MEKLAYLGSSVPKSTASSLTWWVKVFTRTFDLGHDDTCCERKLKQHIQEFDVKSVVQAKPFQLCHMRQVESVCVRATNPVHSALAAWVALLAMGCALKIPRKPRGVANMPWAALRCGVLDEDWGKHVGQVFVNLLSPST